MRHLSRFLSTFEAARVEFGIDGRQKSDIPTGFCLLPGPRTPILDQPVDKKEAFLPFFVYCPSRFKVGYGKNGDF